MNHAIVFLLNSNVNVEKLLGIIYLERKQNFPKNNISYPLTRTHTCTYQGLSHISFSDNFVYVINE